jgi:DNA-binding MurR/RpiR family transcriptional regulator
MSIWNLYAKMQAGQALRDGPGVLLQSGRGRVSSRSVQCSPNGCCREFRWKMNNKEMVPQTAEALRALILERYDSFSGRLQQVARHVLDHPDDLALETLTVIAERAKVQPSAIVRFAKALGFSGANPMQRVLRDSLLANHAALGYGERVRRFNASVSRKANGGDSDEMLGEFVEGDVMALQNLRQTLSATDVTRAIGLLDQAAAVYVMGFRRSFPVASYLAYSLQQVGKRTMFLDGVGGLAAHQVRTIQPNDLLVAISYHPYAEETVRVTEEARAAGAKVLAISDSLVGPIAKSATLVLQVKDSEVRNFRSLGASLCLAQTLVVGLAFERERGGTGRRRRT